MQIEFIQIEPNEDATSIRDRLSFMRGQQVLIIWPEEGTALTRKLDLVLVQREAMRRAIRLAIVTHDPQIIEHASELNISTFETIGAAQRGRWKRGRSRVFTNRAQKPEDEPIPEDLMPVASRVRIPQPGAIPNIVRVGIVLILIALLTGVIILVAPSATVTIDLAEEEIRVETPIVASPLVTTIDIENGIIPATIRKIEIEDSGTRSTSGSESLPPLPATGLVAFFNKGEQAITIPAGTIVSTSAGVPVRFQTTFDATLPAGVDSIIEVNIEAVPESAGSDSNVDAGLINTVEADWSDSVTVINLAATTGGETRELPIVTQSDYDRLQAAVQQRLQSRAQTEFEVGLADNEILISETISIAPESDRADWKDFSHNVGDLTDTLSLTMRAIVQVVVIDERLSHDVAFARMGQQIPRGRIIEPGSLEYIKGPVTAVDEQGQVTFSISGTGKVGGQVNSTLLQERLAGLSVTEAQAYLISTVDLNPGSVPEIIISPDILGRLPFLPVRITIRVIES